MNNDKIENIIKNYAQQQKGSVPIKFHEGITQTLKSLPEKKIRKKKKKWVMYTSTAAVISACIFSSGFISPTMANVLKEVPVIGSVFEKSSNPLLKEVNEKGFTTTITKSAQDKNITMTITDIFFDGTKLALGYVLDVPKDFPAKDELGVPLTFEAFINKERFSYIADFEQNKLSDQKYAGTIYMNIQFEHKKPIEPYHLEFFVKNIHTINGKWDFNFPVENEKIKNATTEFMPNTHVSWKNIELTVKKIAFSPSFSNFEISYKVPSELKEQGLMFYFYDEHKTLLGNGLSVGRKIVSEENCFVTFEETLGFDIQDRIPKSLIVDMKLTRPLKSANDSSIKHLSYDLAKTLPITIPFHDNNAIKITKLEHLPDQTLLHYEVQGDPSIQNAYFILKDENKNTFFYKKIIRTTTDKLVFARVYPALDKTTTITLDFNYDKDDYDVEFKRFKVKLEK